MCFRLSEGHQPDSKQFEMEAEVGQKVSFDKMGVQLKKKPVNILCLQLLFC